MSAQPQIGASGNDITVSGLIAPGQYFQQAIEAVREGVPDIPDTGGAMMLYGMLGDFAVLVSEVANLARLMYESAVESGKVWLEPAPREVFSELASQVAFAAAAAAEVQAEMTSAHEGQIRDIVEGTPGKAAWDIRANQEYL